MDVNSIEPGADFVTTLEEAVAVCDVFLAMIGPQWVHITDSEGQRRLDQWNDFVRIEIASALKQNKVVIPILVGRAAMPSPDELPDDIKSLSRRNAVELSHQRFAYDVEKLIQVIKSATPANSSIKPVKTDSEMIRVKSDALKKIRLDLIDATTSPLYKFRVENRYFPVLGDGNPDANILFIGESPGKYEAAEGIPFTGPSGDVLNERLADIGLKRETVFVTNVLLDCPPEKRSPTNEEIVFYTPFVDQIIDVIRPAVIVPLGRFAMEYILKKYNLPEKRDKISRLHGKLIKAQAAYGEIHVVPMYHPAVVLYSASQKETLKNDFQKLKLFV
jgi:DNA polymerase